MKKLTPALFLLAVTLAACTKQDSPQPVVTPNPAKSATYDIAPGDWTTQDSLTYTATLDVPELDQAIYDHGAVLVYLSFVDNIYEAIPEVFSNISYGTYHSVGSVSVDFYAEPGFIADPPTADVYAKVVLISAEQLAMHPGINLRDFGKIQTTFGVQ
jgi:hypothetical protein